MSKKSRANKSAAAVEPQTDTVDIIVGTTEAIETAVEDGIISQPEADNAVVIETAKADPAADLTVYSRTDFKRDVRKGFESVLLAELDRGPGTPAELLARMTASGEYNRVAPQAFSLRPYKPLLSLLKTWSTGGLLTTSVRPEPVSAAVEELIEA
jgi:hypothetical protein